MIRIALICLFATIHIVAIEAQRTITGTIYLEGEGEAIGANVVVDGDEGIGTLTEFDGTFSIDVPESAKALKVSYTGFATQVVSIKKKNHIKLTLTADNLLSEVVVLGYETIKKSDISTSQSTIRPNENKFLQGSSSGVQVTSANGKPGAGSNIRIRGMGSVNTQNHDPELNENYAKSQPNKFIKSKKEKKSTFSIDVDRASYSNVRRYLKQNRTLPPQDAIRIEEMINYFNYDYPIPTAEEPFSITTELADCPWTNGNQLLRIGLKGYEIELEQSPINNLVFLIDVSGSMRDDLFLVKQSLELLVKNMKDDDKVAIVVYAGNAGLVLPSTNGKDKQQILDAINSLESGGSTAGGAGINLAYKIAKEEFLEEGNNRVILCTDGDFNVGVSSVQDLEKLIEKKREDNIFLTVLGFGIGNYMDYQLETLADKGNGNYAYIDNIKEAKKMLVDEIGATIFAIAKDVKIQIEFDPKVVKSYRLIGYENRLLSKKDFDDDTKDAGELGAGHTVTALYEIVPTENIDKVENIATINLRYKLPKETTSKLIERKVSATSKSMENANKDFKFLASVTAWAMILRDSPYKGSADIEMVIHLAKEGLGDDENGYRKEYLELIDLSIEWGEGLVLETKDEK